MDAFDKSEIDIKNFEMIETIADSSYGSVYKVIDRKSGTIYAAKTLNSLNDEEKSIDREVDIMLFANHPTIVKTLGYSRKGFNEFDGITIIMEYAKNGSLDGVLKQIQEGKNPSNFTNTNRQIIMAGIARGMQYLHDHNIIHRDLKPLNILLDENYYPYITDFGLSKYYLDGDSHKQSIFGGTVAYEAPEIFNGKEYDKKVDVYAFGIILFQIVTNLNPYPELNSSEKSQFKLIRKVTQNDYRPNVENVNKNVDENIIKLIQSCWSKDPSERPTFNEIFEKLSNTNSENNYLLKDVDLDKFEKYIKCIQKVDDRLERQFYRVISIKNQTQKIKDDNKKLEEEKTQLQRRKVNLKKRKTRFSCTKNKKTIKIKKENEHLKKEKENQLNEQLEIENKEKNDRINILLNDNEQLRVKNRELNNSLNKFVDETKTTQKKYENLIKLAKISKFNSYPLMFQQQISENISTNLFFNKLNDLFQLIIQFDQTITSNIEIITNKDCLMKDINEECCILIHYEILKALYQNEYLEDPEFFRILNEFKNICFEIEYQTDSFDDVYGKILNIKKELTDESVSISIYVNEEHNFIESNAFNGCTSLSQVKISLSVMKIGEAAFNGCTSLIQITIPFSVTEIDSSAFYGCSSLKVVIIQSQLTSIKERTFSNCSSLEQILIPSSVKCIENHAFTECTSLKEVTIPSAVNKIGENSFSCCSSLSQITFEINSHLTEIKKGAFCHCSSLKQILIPPSVQCIENHAFTGCSSLKEVTIPSAVNKIGGGCFSSCSSLSQITFEINSHLTEIKKGAFCHCSSLKQILIPPSVKCIEDHAFTGCSSLKEVTIPSAVNKIGGGCFSSCSSLSQITFEINSHLTEIDEGTFSGCISLAKIKIPPSVKIISEGSFNACSSLLQVSIPKSVNFIGENCFAGCTSLTNIDIPFSDAFIGEGCFLDCNSLKTISLPSSLKSIKSTTFKGCSSLMNIIIPSSVTEIGYGAFSGCSSLVEVSIPNSVIKLGKGTFCGCSSLKKVFMPISLTNADESIFDKCTSLIEISNTMEYRSVSNILFQMFKKI